MLQRVENFDPSTWSVCDHEHRIYADDYEEIFAIVDAQDYWYFAQWRWQAVPNKNRKKLYLKRMIRDGRRSKALFLHVEIQKRGCSPLNLKHTMVDHRNGNSLDCRRSNLRWATPSMNRRNLHGREVEQPAIV